MCKGVSGDCEGLVVGSWTKAGAGADVSDIGWGVGERCVEEYRHLPAVVGDQGGGGREAYRVWHVDV